MFAVIFEVRGICITMCTRSREAAKIWNFSWRVTVRKKMYRIYADSDNSGALWRGYVKKTICMDIEGRAAQPVCNMNRALTQEKGIKRSKEYAQTDKGPKSGSAQGVSFPPPSYSQPVATMPCLLIPSPIPCL